MSEVWLERLSLGSESGAGGGAAAVLRSLLRPQSLSSCTRDTVGLAGYARQLSIFGDATTPVL